MPELPEVETMRRLVEHELAGRRLTRLDLRLPKLLRSSPLPDLSLLLGHRLVAASRRAKILIIDFDGDLSVMIHFKLSGQLALVRPDGSRVVAGHPVPNPAGTYPHKATHLTMEWDDGRILYFSDIRQFAWLRLMPSADVATVLASFRFGPEAVGPEMIERDELAARLARRTIPLKLALLDQTLIAGLGNIYVDEALHRARLHPQRPANSLSADELDGLYEAVPWALEHGLEQGGAKIVHGRAVPQDEFPAVHGREGEPCFRCGTTIIKIRVGSRGTYLCPVCQPTPRIDATHAAAAIESAAT